jgi:hypothetical protein
MTWRQADLGTLAIGFAVSGWLLLVVVAWDTDAWPVFLAAGAVGVSSFGLVYSSVFRLERTGQRWLRPWLVFVAITVGAVTVSVVLLPVMLVVAAVQGWLAVRTWDRP